MELSNASSLLASLGHETRLAIFRLLVQAGPEGMNASAIGERLQLAGPTLSFHLSNLSRTGLILGTRESRFIRYCAAYETMDELIAFLTRDCCQGAQLLPQTTACDTVAKRRSKTRPLPGELRMQQEVNDIPPPIVLVLCTGNSCRSQMAEAILNHDLAGRVFALSAGTLPQPHVAPNALEALRQIGMATEGLRPKHVSEMLDAPVDLVVTVCDGAAEACPVFPRPLRKIHVPFPDPHGKTLEAFIAVRDAIREQLPARVCQTLGLSAPDVIHR